MAIIVNKGGGGKKKKGTRDAWTYGIVGKKGQGKSTKINSLVFSYLKRFSKRWHKNGYNKMPRVFIHDLSEAESFKIFPSIEDAARKYGFKHPMDLVAAKDTNGNPLWKHGPLRFSRNRSGDIEKVHSVLSQHFKDGMVVFDECTKYMNYTLAEWMKTMLVKHRNAGVEAVYVFHELSNVPTHFTKGRAVNVWELFDTGEAITEANYQRYLAKFSQRDLIFQGWQELMKLEATNDFMQPHVTVYE